LLERFHTVPLVASRTIFAVSPEGGGQLISIGFEAPLIRSGGDWGAKIFLDILDTFPVTIYGIDSWQAVREAMRFVVTRMNHFAEEGWRFYWEKDGEQFEPNDLW
jgi:hypothetical protein